MILKSPTNIKSPQQGQKAPVIDHKKFTHDFEKFSILALKRVVDHKTPYIKKATEILKSPLVKRALKLTSNHSTSLFMLGIKE